eukprot:1485005-Rhodomonas_salina.1
MHTEEEQSRGGRRALPKPKIWTVLFSKFYKATQQDDPGENFHEYPGTRVPGYPEPGVSPREARDAAIAKCTTP